MGNARLFITDYIMSGHYGICEPSLVGGVAVVAFIRGQSCGMAALSPFSPDSALDPSVVPVATF